MTFEELITQFANTVGIEDIAVEEEGCVFTFDDFPIEVIYDGSFDRVMMKADIGTLDAKRQGELTAKLSQLNLAMAMNGGHTLAADLESGTVYCIHGLPLAGLPLERFAAEMRVMVAKSRAARDLLGVEIALARTAHALQVSQLPGEITLRV